MNGFTEEPVLEPIAIIGLSGKFAGDARTPEELWKMMAEGRSAWTEIPSSRFRLNGSSHHNPETSGAIHVQGGHFISEDIALFDAPFFNLSSEATAALDPQFRLQLESAYEALENAGLSMPHVAGSNTSVYAGLWKSDYRDGMIRDGQDLPKSFELGTGGAFAANRISHFFDFRGASLTLDTACSTSLVALHQAVRGLRSGDASMSIVGASNLMLNPDTFTAMGAAGFLSPDGKCFAFDSRANGYGRGEGVSTIILKRLGDALAAGDPIRAVIRETLVNQDGKTDSISSPSQSAQEGLIRDCYRRAALDPRDTHYCEAHGTGTKVGDPIEAAAIAAVFQPNRPVDQPLRVGAVKTNIGHTEVASGLAALVKVTLAMEKGIIPPSINFSTPNRDVALESAGLKLVTEREEWPLSRYGVRRASINSFGYGGTNAHVILESADSVISRNAVAPLPSANQSQVLLLSARSEEACKNTVTNLINYLESRKAAIEEELMRSIVYTYGQRRTLLPFVAVHRVPSSSSIHDFITALRSQRFKPHRASRCPRIGMIFTGQGAQWYAMGRELITAYPSFRDSIWEADNYLKGLGAEWRVLDELHCDADSTRINDTALSIPICVALQISLTRLLRSWGIVPNAVASHSSGEISAAYAVGALTFKSAMAVAYYRAALAADKALRNGFTKGSMIAIGAGVEDAGTYLERLKGGGRAVIACINSPLSVTLAGDPSAIQEVEDMAKADSKFARKLRVDTAYHSHHMEPIAEPYRNALCEHQIQMAEDGDTLRGISFSSNVTGGRIFSADELIDPEHWVDSLVQPVRFVDAITDMVLGDFDPSGTSVDVFVEVGPHPALGGPTKEILMLPEFNDIQIPYYSCLSRNTDASDSMQDLAANLLGEGCPINLEAVNFPETKGAHVRVLTDLPSYPWDHKTRHWYEPRVNKAIRERSPSSDLIGLREPWSNPSTPSWRHIFRADDAPWVKDSKISSRTVYPSAGFICLAISAIAQTAGADNNIDDTSEKSKTVKAVKGYCLKGVTVHQTLTVPEDSGGIEIQTSLSPVSDKAIGSQDFMHFVITSVTTKDSQWTQHASGMVSLDCSDADESAQTTFATDVKGSSGTRHSSASDDFYSSLKSIGIKYGPSFQNLKTITRLGNSVASEATFAIADAAGSKSSPPGFVLHPTTFDSVIQAVGATLSEARIRQGCGMTLGSISKLWVSNNISREARHQFTAHSRLGHNDSRSVKASVSVFPHDNAQKTTSPVLNVEDLVLMAEPDGRDAVVTYDSEPWREQICSKVEWAPLMSLATPSNLRTLKGQLSDAPDPQEADLLMDLRRICIYFIQDALAALAKAEVEEVQSHLKKYHAWLNAQMQLANTGKLGVNSAQWTQDSSSERQRRIEGAAKASVNGEMVCQLGPHLAAMLRRDILPLDLMMENKLLYRYYSELLKLDRSYRHAAGLFRRLVHKNPRARILEIGAGTGGMTQHALQTLGTAKTGGPMASLYHFTDISAAFFETAMSNFGQWGELIRYDRLDVEKDPTEQGFEIGSYDIVIAFQVLHATKNMVKTMSNVRKLMKPGGNILMIEATQDQTDVQFVFGLLPGWWLSEEHERTSSPSLSISHWDRVLKQTGFTGVDLEIHDCESEEFYSLSTIMSATQSSQPPLLPSEDIVLVTDSRASVPNGWQESLQRSLASDRGIHNGSISVQSLERGAMSSYSGKICVVLAEVERPLLQNLTAAELEGIKAMIISCKGLLWITCGGAVDCERPDSGLAAGFMRSLRNEHVGRKFMTIDLDPKTPVWSDSTTFAILQVLKAEFDRASGTAEYDVPDEFEYAVRDGFLLVPRIWKDMDRNKIVQPDLIGHSATESVSEKLFHQVDYSLCMQVPTSSQQDTLTFDRDVRPIIRSDNDLPDNMIQIEPRAYGVTFRDTLVVMDQLNERVMGMECAGIITRVGRLAASQGYVSGDRVMCLLQGPFASRVCTEWTNVVRMPESVTFEEAATLPVSFSIALTGLSNGARLQRGQSVLIHAAAGGVGQAAIMIAQHVGAKIFATVGSVEKKNLIMSRYGIPSDHIFSSRDVSFARGVLSMTSERGVDVILNSLSGTLLQASFDMLAPFGHFVDIDMRDSQRNSSLEMRSFTHQTSFSSVNLLALIQHRGNEIHKALTEIASLLAEGVIKPVFPITAMPMAKAAEAFEHVCSGQSMGKVALTTGQDETVPVSPYRPTAELSRSASYLLVGGIGGIGRSIVSWMIEHGAKNLILLSRSAGNVTNTGAFVSQMQETGCRIKSVSCDVANAESLSTALQECQQERMPPVRGIIQAAMVLKDSIIDQMTIEDWRAAILPKVNGTWNLHSQFQEPGDLDFFVILSSIIGVIGNASQTNYAAGGSYQDALARWRVAQGLPAVSLDLAAVKSVGHAAQTQGVSSRMVKLGHMPHSEETVMNLIQLAILQPYSGQVIAGINVGPGAHWNQDGSSQLGRDARFWGLHYRQPQGQKEARNAATDAEALSSLLAAASSRGEAERLVSRAIAQKLADVFAIPTDDVDLSKPPGAHGVDSLVGTELRNMLRIQAEAKVSSFEIMQSASLAALAGLAASRSGHVEASLFS